MITEYFENFIKRSKMLAYDTLIELQERPCIGGGIDLKTLRQEQEINLRNQQTLGGVEKLL